MGLLLPIPGELRLFHMCQKKFKTISTTQRLPQSEAQISQQHPSGWLQYCSSKLSGASDLAGTLSTASRATFALLGGAAASVSSSALLPEGRHLPLQTLQTLPQGSKVHLTAAGARTRIRTRRDQLDLMGEDQRRAGTQVDFSAWEAQRNRLNPKYGTAL